MPRDADITPANAAPRCHARTRSGTECRAPAIRGRTRCRKHGGHPLAGAPCGNRNALKHGLYGAALQAEYRAMVALLREMREGVEG